MGDARKEREECPKRRARRREGKMNEKKRYAELRDLSLIHI